MTLLKKDEELHFIRLIKFEKTWNRLKYRDIYEYRIHAVSVGMDGLEKISTHADSVGMDGKS